MFKTFTAAKETVIMYARRDSEMWHVLCTEDGYQVISNLDRKTWYQESPVMYTADPVFLVR